ncbi:endonuclease/exonuclease/phosphatase family protein [Spirochaetia bacterium]|nr:endonuclease/exonuclease/phosphatase family protein [Spirochaetia bacterium]
MKIVSWNCHCGLSKEKALFINKLEADIYIIQETKKTNHDSLNDIWKYSTWYGDDLDGDYGISLFSAKYEFELLPNFNKNYRYVIPFIVKDTETKFVIFSVWTKLSEWYIGPVWNAINDIEYKNIFENHVILIGDFNSNKYFDKGNIRKKQNTHTDVVTKLKEFNIESAYHKYYNLEQGDEKHPTLYWTYKEDKPFHIDYCFLSNNYKIVDFKVGTYNEYVESKLSDHCPLIITLDTLHRYPLKGT